MARSQQDTPERRERYARFLAQIVASAHPDAPDPEWPAAEAVSGKWVSLMVEWQDDVDPPIYVVADSTFPMHGSGPTIEAAFGDYLDTLRDLRDILREHGNLGRNQVDFPALLDMILAGTTG